jgi:hypothetical protein
MTLAHSFIHVQTWVAVSRDVAPVVRQKVELGISPSATPAFPQAAGGGGHHGGRCPLCRQHLPTYLHHHHDAREHRSTAHPLSLLGLRHSTLTMRAISLSLSLSLSVHPEHASQPGARRYVSPNYFEIIDARFASLRVVSVEERV